MPVTTNRSLNVAVTGSDVGVWGSNDLNPNFAALDTMLGGVSAVALSSSNVTLSSTQYANGTIRLSGVLAANVLVLFPNVQGWWTVENLCTGNFTASARLVAGGNQIGTPPGEAWDVLADGTNMKYRNLPHPIGCYWDDCGTAVPAWVTACTVPPYLLCDGSAFSAVTYPYLNTKLGGTTLPDLRGRARFNLNGGTGRITTANSGIDGDTRLSAGGSPNVSISQGNLPNYNLSAASLSVTGAVAAVGNPGYGFQKSNATNFGPGANNPLISNDSGAVTWSGAIGGSVPSGGSGTALITQATACIGGITMIRAGG